MYHFFVPEAGEGPEISIVGPDVNHIRNVLRMKTGEKIVISNGEDKDFYCTIVSIDPRRVVARVLPEAVEESELAAQLFLFQGLPKGTKMETVIQKAVELGAAGIVPVAMSRCVVRLEEKKRQGKRLRWQAVAESAAKQCGRRIVPEVGEVSSFAGALEQAADMDLILVPYENARGVEVTRQALSRLRPGMRAAVFIGPEGGFAASEIEALTAAGAEIISLGRRILRTETAGMAALTLCMMTLEWAEAGKGETKHL